MKLKHVTKRNQAAQREHHESVCILICLVRIPSPQWLSQFNTIYVCLSNGIWSIASRALCITSSVICAASGLDAARCDRIPLQVFLHFFLPSSAPLLRCCFSLHQQQMCVLNWIAQTSGKAISRSTASCWIYTIFFLHFEPVAGLRCAVCTMDVCRSIANEDEKNENADQDAI